MAVRVRVSNKGRKISKKSQRSQNTKLQFPSEILVQIASKLPVTKILQCCQPLSQNNHKFDNIISDPMFPSLFQSHNNNNKSSSKNTTFLAYDGVANSCTLIDYSPDHLSEFRVDNSDFIRRSKYESRTILSTCSVVGSCNGWVLFCSLLGGNFSRLDSLSPLSASSRLVNPITRRCLVLPEAPYAVAWGGLNYGLGYGSKTGLLKVVRLYHQYGSAKITAEVMTVRAEGDCAWEVMDTEWSVRFTSIRSKPVVLNGALHWLVNNNNNLILRFDIDQEKFDFIPSPYTTKTPTLNKENPKMMIVSYLGVLDGLLCVGAACGSTTIDDKGVEIWLMKEYGFDKSWTRFTVIDGLDINDQFVLTPVIKDGKLLILTTLLSRNPDVKEFFVDVYDPKLRKRDKRVALLEGVDEKTRARMTVDHFVPSFL